MGGTVPRRSRLVKYVIALLLDIMHLIGSASGVSGRIGELIARNGGRGQPVGGRIELRAERGEARFDLFETTALRELTERAAIGRDRIGFLARELLRAPEPDQKLLV